MALEAYLEVLAEQEAPALEAFRKTRRWRDDLGELNESFEGYAGNEYLELSIAVEDKAKNSWRLGLSNEDWVAPLEELEVRLFEFACRERYMERLFPSDEAERLAENARRLSENWKEIEITRQRERNAARVDESLATRPASSVKPRL